MGWGPKASYLMAMLLKGLSSRAASYNGPCLKTRSVTVMYEEFVQSNFPLPSEVKYITCTPPRDLV